MGKMNRALNMETSSCLATELVWVRLRVWGWCWVWCHGDQVWFWILCLWLRVRFFYYLLWFFIDFVWIGLITNLWRLWAAVFLIHSNSFLYTSWYKKEESCLYIWKPHGNYLSCKCQPERLATSLKAALQVSTFSMFSLKHSSCSTKDFSKLLVCFRTSDGSTS